MAELNKDQVAFLNEFNWHNYAEGIDAVDENNLREFEEAGLFKLKNLFFQARVHFDL